MESISPLALELMRGVVHRDVATSTRLAGDIERLAGEADEVAQQVWPRAHDLGLMLLACNARVLAARVTTSSVRTQAAEVMMHADLALYVVLCQIGADAQRKQVALEHVYRNRDRVIAAAEETRRMAAEARIVHDQTIARSQNPVISWERRMSNFFNWFFAFVCSHVQRFLASLRRA